MYSVKSKSDQSHFIATGFKFHELQSLNFKPLNKEMLNLNIYLRGQVFFFFFWVGPKNGSWNQFPIHHQKACEGFTIWAPWYQFLLLGSGARRSFFFFLFSFLFFVFLEPEDQRSWVEAHLYNFCSLSACFLLLVSKCEVPKRKRINSKKIFYNGYFHLWLVRSIRETSSLKSITLCLIKFAHLKKNIFK